MRFIGQPENTKPSHCQQAEDAKQGDHPHRIIEIATYQSPSDGAHPKGHGVEDSLAGGAQALRCPVVDVGNSTDQKSSERETMQ